MSKQDNLKDYLTDLYQGIASKKPDASRNPQDFRSEIESIETECSENHIVEVTELPTENIDKNAVYYIQSENSHYRYEKCTEIVTYMGDSGAIPLGDHPLTMVSTKPTANIKAYTDTYKHIYYVENENDMFMYTLSETTGAYEWASMSALFGVTFKGFIDTSSEAGEEGLFAVSPHYEWFKYYIPSGDLKITENGTFDVTEVAEVVVNVPSEEPTLQEKTITENGEYLASTEGADGFSKVVVNVPSGGSSGGSTECSLNHIVEVDTLPTKNIEDGSICKVRGMLSIAYYEDGMTAADIFGEDFGLILNYYIVSTLPETGNDSDCCYVEGDDIYLYNGDGSWMSVGIILAGSFNGAITDVSQMNENGYYAFLGNKLYLGVNGEYKLLLVRGDLIFTSNGDGTCVVSSIEPNYDSFITIPSVSPSGDAVTSIDSMAFFARTFIGITIPNSVTSIGASAFSHCSSLGTVNLPNSITKIEDSAFIECTALKEIVIPDGVETIGSYAFENCTALTKVTIPKSVIEIESWAFRYCHSLIDIYYEGTVNQWSEIGKGAAWNDEILATVVICSDGNATL